MEWNIEFSFKLEKFKNSRNLKDWSTENYLKKDSREWSSLSKETFDQLLVSCCSSVKFYMTMDFDNQNGFKKTQKLWNVI